MLVRALMLNRLARIIGGSGTRIRVHCSNRTFMPTKTRTYRVTFHNQGKVYEIYARNVSHGGMPGFVEVEKLLFGENSTLVMDTSEEKLKTEFEGVERFYVPLHAVVRIDEVSKQGAARISSGGDKVLPFPMMYGTETKN